MALCVNKDWLADTEKHHARFVFDPKTTHERPKRIEQTAQFIVLSCLGAFEKSPLQFESSCDRVASFKSTATQHVLTTQKNLAKTLASTPNVDIYTPHSSQHLHMSALKEMNKLHSTIFRVVWALSKKCSPHLKATATELLFASLFLVITSSRGKNSCQNADVNPSCLSAFGKMLPPFESNCDGVGFCKSILTYHIVNLQMPTSFAQKSSR